MRKNMVFNGAVADTKVSTLALEEMSESTQGHDYLPTSSLFSIVCGLFSPVLFRLETAVPMLSLNITAR